MTDLKTLPLFTITHAIDWEEDDDHDADVQPLRCKALAEPQRHGRERVMARDPKGTPFRIYDDDGRLYFRGRYYGTGPDDEGFEPLSWAMYDSGCTRIDYFERMPDGTRKWCTL